MLCLTHLPKTGGTTFRNILINNYSWRHVDFPNFPKEIIRPDDFPLNSSLLRKQIKSLSGHRFRYSDEIKVLFPDFKFIVFLREPISRIISLYFHIQRFENSELNFREWVDENYDTPLLSNSQTLFVAGKPDLSRAKSIIDNEYFFAGSTELFDNSVLMLKKMLGNQFDVRYVRKNVASSHKDEILENAENRVALQKLHEHNELDIQLHDYVKKTLFPTYQQKYGEITETDLLEFVEVNKKFRPDLLKVNVFRVVKYLFFENMFRIRSVLKKKIVQ